MDDIARDHDAQAAPAADSRSRLKGPVAEFAVEESAVEGPGAGVEWRVDQVGGGAGPAASRLPRVLPLEPVEDASDDDLLVALPAEPAARAAGSPAPGDGGEAPGASVPGGEGAGSDQPEEPGEEGPGGEGPVDEEIGPAPQDPTAALDADLQCTADPISDPGKLARVVFGLLLTCREGLSVLRLAQVCDTTQDAVRAALDMLRRDFATAPAPLELTQSGDTFKLWTTPEVFPYLEKLRGIKKNERLSPAALETLAVIAYRQPVFRAEIEAIRGVKVGPMLRSLLDCKLVKVVGRADVPGRPLQYGTTQLFLERFGLTALTDLPSVKEFKGLSG